MHETVTEQVIEGFGKHRCPIAQIARIFGEKADRDAPPQLVVEVPHGADELEHYVDLRGKLESDLPEGLIDFFCANTDVGAFAVGLRVAERVVAADPSRSAVVVRCLVPRTFVDTNRAVDAEDTLASGGLTPGIPPYITDEADLELLSALHRRYLKIAAAWLKPTLQAGGFALLPHTYGPRSMLIARVDRDIVNNIREAWEPDTWSSLPLRPEVDLLTRDVGGQLHAPAELIARLLESLAGIGAQAVENETYALHPATQGWRWARDFPDQSLCLEIRRDLLVERFDLLAPMTVDPQKVERFAAPIADEVDRWLQMSAWSHTPPR